MSSLVTKIVAGAPQRKTRLHNEKGELVSLSRLVRNGPRAIATGALRTLLNIRPELPWISYDAQDYLARHLTPSSRVLEFGSGMSTVWYARHAGQVVSIEDNPVWFKLIEATIRRQPNVDYRLAKSATEYTSFAPQPYDLIMVDGSHRAECMEAALPYLAPGGIIYLDNSDKGSGGTPGDVPHAERLLLDYARQNGCSTRHFTDFAPTQLFVQEGLLVARPHVA